MRKLLWILMMMCSIFSSCENNSQPVKQKSSEASTEEKLIWANQRLVRVENDLISSYIKRHELQMNQSASGLRYLIRKEGEGQNPKFEQTVTLKYSLKLINGNEVYNSDRDGLKKFIIGKSQEPSGLDEGVRILKKGGKALLIMPSNLGYGLLGDSFKIPKKAILIYEVELINIK